MDSPKTPDHEQILSASPRPSDEGPLDRLSPRARIAAVLGGLVLLLLLAALALGTLGTPSDAPSPSPDESLPAPTASPIGSFVLPEGALRIPAGTRVSMLATDEGGAWAADLADLRVSRVGGGSAYTLGGTPSQIAAAPGVLWVTLSDSGELVRIAAGSATPLRYALPRGAGALRLDRSGRAWMSISGEDRVFTADGSTTLTIEIAGGPAALLPRVDDALVWLASERTIVTLRGDGTVGARSSRLPVSTGPWLLADAGTRVLLADVGADRLYLFDAEDLALLAQVTIDLPLIDLVAADGFAVALLPTGFARIDLANGTPATPISTERIIPGAVIDPRGGALYLTAPDGGRVLAYDLQTGRELRRWTVGGTLAAPLLDGRGAIWVLDTSSNEAVRIAPPGEVLLPTPTPWPSPSATPTPSPTPTPTPSEDPILTPVPTPIETPPPPSSTPPPGGERQTITFPAQPDREVGDPPFDPGATASSGLKVVYSTNNPVVCRVSGGLISIVSDGSCRITASQPGNSRWAPAEPKSRTINVLAPGSLGADPGSGGVLGLAGDTLMIAA